MAGEEIPTDKIVLWDSGAISFSFFIRKFPEGIEDAPQQISMPESRYLWNVFCFFFEVGKNSFLSKQNLCAALNWFPTNTMSETRE